MPERLPAGYRQGLITGMSVIIGFSLYFLRFDAIEPSSGDWSPLGAWVVAVIALSSIIQIYALWRGLGLGDDDPAAYTRTVRIFGAAVLLLGVGLSIQIGSTIWSAYQRHWVPASQNG